MRQTRVACMLLGTLVGVAHSFIVVPATVTRSIQAHLAIPTGLHSTTPDEENNVNEPTKKFPNTASSTDMSSKRIDSNRNEKDDAFYLPTMIVFDLDDCLWTPEMYQLSGKPTIPVNGVLNPHEKEEGGKLLRGVVGVSVPSRHSNTETVTLYNGARRALFELATNPKYASVTIAVASSSEEPTYSHACLEAIEILPGRTMGDMIQYNQIGRTGTLTSRKTTHFKALHRDSGVPYEEMLFFDDCNWGDHCGDVTRTFGVVSQRTPNGLQWIEFQAGLKKYKDRELEQTKQVLKMVR